MLRRLIAGFLMSCFVLLSIPLAIAFGFYSTFSDESFYRGEFTDLSYELIISQFPGMLEITDHTYVTDEDLIIVAREVFVKSDFESVLDSLIEQFQTAEVDENHELQFSFPLSWLTGKSPQIADSLSKLFIKKLPKCDQQITDFSLNELKCIPEGITRSTLKGELEKVVRGEVFDGLHDDYIFALNLPSNIEGNFSVFIKDSFFFVLMASLGLLVFILVVVSLVIYKPWVNIARVIFKTIFIASFSLSINLWLVLWLPGTLQENLSTGLTSDIVLSFSTLIVGAMVRKMLIVTMPVLLISLVLYIFSSYRYKDYLKLDDAS